MPRQTATKAPRLIAAVSRYDELIALFDRRGRRKPSCTPNAKLRNDSALFFLAKRGEDFFLPQTGGVV